jgi:hypothetical protein
MRALFRRAGSDQFPRGSLNCTNPAAPACKYQTRPVSVWLDKLNHFNGNFEQAEMVRAFVISTEYRDRFPRQYW